MPHVIQNDSESIAELTLRSVLLAVILTIILAISNAYLALKLGILTSASIPAAMISMGILRFFKHATILENNAVQTAASAGEAVAGGIVYTIPALIVIGYWHHFDYWTNFFIAFLGGVLGVLVSIPLRSLLVHEPSLRFPEGRAIAEVLQSSRQTAGLSDILSAGMVGAVLELFQLGFKWVASSWTHAFVIQRTLCVVGVGFSATMIGAGFLIGFDMAVSLLLGAFIAWGIALPVASHFFPSYMTGDLPLHAVTSLWNGQVRYVGIGAMLCAGVWTFLCLFKPLVRNILDSLAQYKQSQHMTRARIDHDIPMPYIVVGLLAMSVILVVFFNTLFPWARLGFQPHHASVLLGGSVLYVLFVGTLMSVITAYFSGMVGVSASPGSSVVIAGMLFAAWLLLTMMSLYLPLPLHAEQLAAAQAVVIILGSVVTGMAAIANDTTQDLKVGQLVGATPWRQQVMLLLGVVVSALVIPPVMQALFSVYGISGVMPHAGMDVAQSLPAPVSAMLAAMTEAVFHHILPWQMMLTGAGIIGIILFSVRLFSLNRYVKVSVLGVAMGMYLPLSSSTPLFVGGAIAWYVQKRLRAENLATHREVGIQRGVRLACGLVAGSALFDVVLALIFSVRQSPDALRLVGDAWVNYGVMSSVLLTLCLSVWMIMRCIRQVVTK